MGKRSSSELDRIGVEIELLAPAGVTRADVATAIAQLSPSSESRVVPIYAAGIESSRSGPNNYFHLTRGVKVVNAEGEIMCRLVDDATIQEGLSTDLSESGDYRIVVDDKRLLWLIERNTSAASSLRQCLLPLAKMYKTDIRATSDRRRYRVVVNQRTIATALTQRSGRERVVEIVTPVITGDYRQQLDQLLAPARAQGCVVPVEAAVHVHFDAEPFRDPGRLARLVDLFQTRAGELKDRFATNPRCRMLGPQPPELIELLEPIGRASSDGEVVPEWQDFEPQLMQLRLPKLADINLRNLQARAEGKDTVEIRILGPAIDTDQIVGQIHDLQTLLTNTVL